MNRRVGRIATNLQRTARAAGLPFLFVAIICFTQCAIAQLSEIADWKNGLGEIYVVTNNIVYSGADSIHCRFDLYTPKSIEQPTAAFIWFHGGGWSRGSKDSSHANTMWFLKQGFVVINANYRLAPAAPAPAAVEDSRCLLRWVIRNAEGLHIDKNRIVIGGGSAGAHLALMAGMLEEGSVFDASCLGSERLQVAAILNFNGNIDVCELLEGKSKRGFAVRWIGDRPDRDSFALAVSPISYVRKDLPPIMTVHGDKDSTVPYEQAVRFHEALVKAGAEQEFMTIRGGGHGKYSKQQEKEIWTKVRSFLTKYKILG